MQRCEICHKPDSALVIVLLGTAMPVPLQYMACKGCSYELKRCADLINYKLEEIDGQTEPTVDPIHTSADAEAARSIDRSGSGLLLHRNLAGDQKTATKTATRPVSHTEPKTG